MRGRQMSLAIEIDRNRQLAGIQYGPGDLTYCDVLFLRLLAEERETYADELMRESREGRRRH